MPEATQLGILMIGGLGALVLLLPFYGLWAYNRRKIEEIRVRGRVHIGEETQRSLEEIRRELHALRDTTTNYDMGFDSAMHRIEARMAHLESRVNSNEVQNVSAGFRS